MFILSKKLLYIVSIVLLLFSATQLYSQDELNLYSARKEHLIKPLIELFEKETNIKVNLVTAKAAQLHQRILTESNNSIADVLLTTDAGNLWKADKANFFQSVNSEILNNRIDKKYRDENNKWWGLSLRARIFVYNTKTVKKDELKGYKFLSDPIFKSRILIRSSGNIYNQSLIAHMIEKYGMNSTEIWAKGLVNNFARDPAGGDRDQIKAVAAGVGDIAIVNSYYFAKLISSEKKDNFRNLKVHFPKDEIMGTHLNISGAGVMKNAPNLNSAIRFIEFLSSDKAQKIYSYINYEYPVVNSVGIPDSLKKWGIFYEDNVFSSAYGRHGRLAIQIADRVGWN